MLTHPTEQRLVVLGLAGIVPEARCAATRRHSKIKGGNLILPRSHSRTGSDFSSTARPRNEKTRGSPVD